MRTLHQTVRMRLVVVALCLAGCYDPPMFEVEVAWSTIDMPSEPDPQVGARLDYLRAEYDGTARPASEWYRGYAGEQLVMVDSTETTRTICLTLVRREPIDNGEFGCSDCPDERFTAMSMTECQDVVLDVEPVHVEFAVAATP